MSLLRKQWSAGRRRTRVVVEVATDAAANDAGEVHPEYLPENSFIRYAEEMLTSGREFVQAMQVIALLQGVIKLPYDSATAAITARDRVKIGSRVLNLAAPPINDGGQNRTMILWVVEPEQ